MAKRKKLNKRVAILLGSMGGVLVALVLTVSIRGCGEGSLLDRFFPRDPVEMRKQARAATEKNDFVGADRLFRKAIAAAIRTDAANIHEYYFEYAKLNHRWALTGVGLTQTEQLERFQNAGELLRKALGRNPDYIDAERFLSEMTWAVATYSNSKGEVRARYWSQYVSEADKVLKLDPNDHMTYYRRGVARGALYHQMGGGLDKDALTDFHKAIELSAAGLGKAVQEKKDEKDLGKLKAGQVMYWRGLIEFLSGLEGRSEEVETAYQEAIEANPDDAGLLITHAEFLRKQGNSVMAEQRLKEAIKRDAMAGNLALADHYVELGKLDEAMEALKVARQIDKRDPRVYVQLARVFDRQQKPKDEVEALRAGLAEVETVITTLPAGRDRLGLAGERARLSYLLANTLLDMAEARPPDHEKLLAEARTCQLDLSRANLSEARRAKIAGRILLAEGKTEEAMKSLETAYQKFGGQFDIKIANLLINLYLQRDFPGKAEVILDRLLNMPGQRDNVSALTAKMKLLLRYRSFDRAERIARMILHVDPANTEARNARLLAAAAQGDTPAVPADLRISPETVGALLDRSMTLWLDGRRKEAVEFLEQLHKQAPGNLAVIARLANWYRLGGRKDEAEKVLKAGLALYPDSKQIESRLVLLNETDPVKQRDMLLKIADDMPPLDSALEKANVWRAAGNEAKYFEYLQKAAEIDPNTLNVVDRLFRYAVEKKDWKLAQRCAGQAAKADLDGCNGKLYEARVALAQQDYAAARAAAEELLSKRPNRKDGRVVLGECYLKQRQYDEAYEAFLVVSRADPGYAPALIGLAMVTDVQGKQREHEEYVNRAYQLVPQHPYIREEYLETEERKLRPEELIVRRERTLKQQPNDVENLMRLGQLYEKVGRLDRAEDMYVSLHQKSQNRLYSARVLCGFYARHGRLEDVDRVMTDIVNTWADRVGALVLYGEFLTNVDAESAQRTFEKAIATDASDPRGFLGMARFYAAKQNWPKAIESMKRYIDLRPKDPGGAKELALYLAEAGDIQGAEARLKAILAEDPSDASAMALQGVLAWRKGDVPRALDNLTQAVQTNPTFAEPLLYRARVYLTQGDLNKAKTDLQAAKRLSSRVEIAMELAGVHQAMRDFDNAELIYREIRADHREYAPAIDQLVGLYTRRQKWRELTDLLAEARKIFPKSPAYWLGEADMWRQRDNKVKELEALGEAVRVAPGATQPLLVYLLALQRESKYAEVVSASESYHENPQYSGWVAPIRAACLAKLGQTDLADKLFQSTTRELKPDYIILVAQQLRKAYGSSAAITNLGKWQAGEKMNWRMAWLLGALYSDAKDLPKAVEALKEGRKLAGTSVGTFLIERYLGSIYHEMGNLPEAEKAYLASLKLGPNDVQVLNNLAYLYANELDQPQKALPYATEAARRQPGNARILDTYGWTLAKLNRLAEAEQYLTKSIQLDKPLATSWYHLGWVYEKLGRYEEAQKQYRQGFEMVRTKQDDPLYKALEEGLARVGPKVTKSGSTP